MVPFFFAIQSIGALRTELQSEDTCRFQRVALPCLFLSPLSSAAKLRILIVQPLSGDMGTLALGHLEWCGAEM
jgi:hypothetical protein